MAMNGTNAGPNGETNGATFYSNVHANVSSPIIILFHLVLNSRTWHIYQKNTGFWFSIFWVFEFWVKVWVVSKPIENLKKADLKFKKMFAD